jgi:Mg2+-importing ATPase
MGYSELSESETLLTGNSRDSGISESEAATRNKKYGLNQIKSYRPTGFSIFLRQLTENPLLIILAAAAVVSFFTGDHNTAYYVFGMILLGLVLGFWNEFSAEKTVEALLHNISMTALVLRDGTKKEIPVAKLTIGDIVLLSPGSIIPADLRLIKAENLVINESVLTGESAPRSKNSKSLSYKGEEISKLLNVAFMGTAVSEGSGIGMAIAIGQDTQFGKIAESVSNIRPVTKFQEGLNKFGNLIVKVIFALTIVVFLINALMGHQLITSLLFSLAIAVGLTPELLPVIITVGLARGAQKMAKKGVITKQLLAIENLGNMDVLCTDKTGTLTEGVIKVTGHFDINGKDDAQLLELALFCNSAVVSHKITGNPIDVALWNHAIKDKIKLPKWQKIHEEPFSYNTQLMFSVIKKADGKLLLIAKGAPEKVIKKCKSSRLDEEKVNKRFIELSKQGFRVIALATRGIDQKEKYSLNDLKDLTFEGFVILSDTPKADAKLVLNRLKSLDVQIKVITGDNEIVTESICKEVGMQITGIVTGEELAKLSSAEFAGIVDKANVFARVSPEQKYLIIKALRDDGHAVGFMGDGVNDVPSLHSADVGISVNTAVDVAKDAAQLILLRKDLSVITIGIEEGRRTFVNVLKYILMGTGSNFGEMISVAGASVFLPFLPMAPAQILLENSLYDISQIPITSDLVDKELITKPKKWNMSLIYRFILFFGTLSAIYSVAIFLIMIYGFHADEHLFQTAWFIESILTEMVIVISVRTMRVPFYKSKPGLGLIIGCVSIAAIGLVLPFSPLASSIGFVVPPASFFLVLLALLVSYLFIVEITKKIFSKYINL